MSFSSVPFIFFLLPITLILYWLAGRFHNIKCKNIVLLVMSIIFYSWCGIEYLVLLGTMLCINYLGIKAMNICKKRKQWLVAIIIANVFILSVFKYFNFFMENIEKAIRLLGHTEYVIGAPTIPLPLGISFFVFQMIAVLVDVYKGEAKVDNFSDFALFIIFFPQLVEGPIIRWNEIANALKERYITYENLENGTRRFIIGFAKKILIADKLNGIVNAIFELAKSGVPLGYSWIGAVCYAFVIYFDFSGYSDMAIGLCKIFGFDIRENFNYPYISKSIQEFWRRWHISLSSWFRDYIYIPLGGNRKGTIYTYRNLFIVFLLTGIWHGANWTFVAWGVFHGVFMLAERAGLKKILEHLPAAISRAYTLIVVLVGWVLFRADNIKQALIYIKSMFIPTNITYRQIGIISLFDSQIIFIIIIASVLSTPIIKRLETKLLKNKIYKFAWNIMLLVIFAISISSMMASSFSPSIYTKF